MAKANKNKGAEEVTETAAENTTEAAGKKAGKKGKRVKGERRVKKGRSKLIGAIILVLLLGAAGGMYYFNIFKVKSRVINFFISQDPQYKDAIAAKSSYETMKSELENKQIELEGKEKQLAEEQAQLEQERRTFKEEQSSANASMDALGGSAGGDQNVVAVLEGMKAAAAADILNRTADNGWVAKVLSQMAQDKAAKILSTMDVDKAVIITRLMSQ